MIYLYIYIYIYVYPHEYLIKFPFSMVSISYLFHLISTNHDIPELLTMAHTVFTRSHSCDQTLGQLGIVSGSPPILNSSHWGSVFSSCGVAIGFTSSSHPNPNQHSLHDLSSSRSLSKKYATSKSVNHHFPCSTLGHTIPFADRQKKDKKKLKQRRGTSADAAEEGVQRLPRS